MAKKNLGRFVAFAAITGAVAAGVSYFLKYRSFHAELEDDFHDYEDGDQEDAPIPFEDESAHRNYVPLGEKKEETMMEEAGETAEEAVKKAEETADTVKEHAEEAAEKAGEAAKGMATTIEEDTSAE